MDLSRFRSYLGLRVDPDPVPVQLPEPLRTEVRAVFASTGLVEAVRLVRQRTGLDLASAVRAVKALVDDAGEQLGK